MSKNSQKIVVIKPNQRFDLNMLSCFIVMLKNLVHFRDMIYQLFKRDFFAVYKKSFIGSVWIVLSPVAAILSWVFLHKAAIIRPGDVGVPYPAYVLVGTMVWGLFMSLYSAVSNTMSHYQYILKHTNVAHEAVYCVQVLVKLVQFALSFVIILLVLLFFRVVPSWWTILTPIVLSPLIFLAVSIGLIVSMFSVLSYDIRRLVTGAMGLLLFITPVIYSPDAIKIVWLRKIILLNPLTYLICSARDIILHGRLYSVQGFLVSSICAIVLLIITGRIFYLAEDKVIERMM